MVDQIMSLPERTRIQLLAPVVRGRKGEHVKAHVVVNLRHRAHGGPGVAVGGLLPGSGIWRPGEKI